MCARIRAVQFAGPSLRGISERAWSALAEFEVLPPVKRGDIGALVGSSPGVLALVDGVFYDSLAVSHIEIREAVEAGWKVWGLSSMGAIRAYEMRDHGVRGFGVVYNMFAVEDDFQDDEVALLHGPAPDYEPLTEPLVHMRVALAHFERAGWLGPADAAALTALMKGMWFGHRTLDRFAADVMAVCLPDCRNDVRKALDHFDDFRVKSQDLDRFLIEQPWRGAVR